MTTSEKTRACVVCGCLFHPHATQKRCESCLIQKCPICGRQFRDSQGQGGKRKMCSRACIGASPQNVARLHSVRGRKPRTSLGRGRPWRGCAEDREWRDAVFLRDGYKCVICGLGGRLQADHILAVCSHPEKRHDLDNGRTLCVDCHKQTPTYGWKGYWLKVRSSAKPVSLLP